MNIILGIIIICISLLNFFSPETSLTLQDMFRIKGAREYSEFAIAMTKFGGLIGIFLGLFVMFSQI